MRKMIGVAKSNHAVAPAPLMYCRPLDGPLQSLGGSPLGIDEVYARLKKGEGSERGATETDKAEEWLLAYMDGKRVLASAIESAAKDEGFKMTTIKRVKLKLGTSSKKENQQWFWYQVVSDQVKSA